MECYIVYSNRKSDVVRPLLCQSKRHNLVQIFCPQIFQERHSVALSFSEGWGCCLAARLNLREFPDFQKTGDNTLLKPDWIQLISIICSAIKDITVDQSIFSGSVVKSMIPLEAFIRKLV